VSTSSSESSAAVRGRKDDLQSPGSVRRKTSLSRLPFPGMYVTGRNKLTSDGPGD